MTRAPALAVRVAVPLEWPSSAPVVHLPRDPCGRWRTWTTLPLASLVPCYCTSTTVLRQVLVEQRARDSRGWLIIRRWTGSWVR